MTFIDSQMERRPPPPASSNHYTTRGASRTQIFKTHTHIHTHTHTHWQTSRNQLNVFGDHELLLSDRHHHYNNPIINPTLFSIPLRLTHARLSFSLHNRFSSLHLCLQVTGHNYLTAAVRGYFCLSLMIPQLLVYTLSLHVFPAVHVPSRFAIYPFSCPLYRSS